VHLARTRSCRPIGRMLLFLGFDAVRTELALATRDTGGSQPPWPEWNERATQTSSSGLSRWPRGPRGRGANGPGPGEDPAPDVVATGRPAESQYQELSPQRQRTAAS
jgi:hypothetical protein